MKNGNESYIAKVNPITLETAKEVGCIAMTLNDPSILRGDQICYITILQEV